MTLFGARLGRVIGRRLVISVLESDVCLSKCRHGADDGSYMTHFVHARGKVDWLEPVSDEDYAEKRG